MIKLRDYQETMLAQVADIIDFVCPTKSYCFVLPTGAGKSVIIGASVAEILKRDNTKRILICSWSRMIVKQNQMKVAAFCTDYESNVDFATVQKLQRNQVDSVYDVIIVDECHKMYRETAGYKAVTGRMRNSNLELRNPKSDTIVLGFTATPYRNKHENVINDTMFIGVEYLVTYDHLIRRGYLVPPVYVKSHLFTLDRDKLHDNGLDFSTESMGMQCAKAIGAITKLIEETHKDHSQDVEDACTLVFLPSVEIVRDVERKLLRGGIECSIILGGTDEESREDIIRDAGIILNCSTMTTGIDITRVTSIVVCRATKSWVLWKQIVGRGLRLHDGKASCRIVDCGSNVETFGMDLDKTLGVTDATQSGLPVLSECKQCHRYIPTTVKSCEYCGLVIRTDEEIHAAKLYNIYYSGGMRPVKSADVKRVTMGPDKVRDVLTIKMYVGKQNQFVFSNHPYSQQMLKETKELLSCYDKKNSTLFILVDKVNGFDKIVDAKLVDLVPKL